MSLVDFKSVRVVDLWIEIFEAGGHGFAQGGVVVTEDSNGIGTWAPSFQVPNAKGINQVTPKLSRYLAKLDQDLILRMVKSRNWSQSHEEVHLLFEILRFHARADKHLGGALGMTNVGGQFWKPCLVQNEIDFSR